MTTYTNSRLNFCTFNSSSPASPVRTRRSKTCGLSSAGPRTQSPFPNGPLQESSAGLAGDQSFNQHRPFHLAWLNEFLIRWQCLPRQIGAGSSKIRGALPRRCGESSSRAVPTNRCERPGSTYANRLRSARALGDDSAEGRRGCVEASPPRRALRKRWAELIYRNLRDRPFDMPMRRPNAYRRFHHRVRCHPSN